MIQNKMTLVFGVFESIWKVHENQDKLGHQ